MTAPAAPLEKAVEESREALAAYERCSDPECSVCVSALEVATRSLLAALGADPHITCDCGRPRLSGPCSGSCDNDE